MRRVLERGAALAVASTLILAEASALPSSAILAAAAAADPSPVVVEAARATAPRSAPTGEGPFLPTITAVLGARPEPVAARAPKELYVDLPCDVFLPGKADPRDWMATSTLVYYTLDGYNYQYGYDPFAQSYDMMVSGLAHSSGILLQETIGVMAAALPGVLQAGQIDRVEVWFLVSSHNLYPYEFVGITALEGAVWPSSSLDVIDIQRLYADARGFTGRAYTIDHYGVGPHAIDLGPDAVLDMDTRIAGEGWFGVGFAADGWDISGSAGSVVEWTVFGGGGLPSGNRPFFRVYYNAPPLSFTLLQPADGAHTGSALPTFAWSAALDPNGDAPITYTVRLGTDPTLTQAVQFSTTDLSAPPPFPLGEATYHWEVEASDPDGATQRSERQSFTVAYGTPVPDAPRGMALRARPNPFNPRTELSFELERPEAGRLEILDLRGRRVRVLHAGTFAEGRQRFVWNGEDDAGRVCASGVYLARVQLGSRQETLRLGLVR